MRRAGTSWRTAPGTSVRAGRAGAQGAQGRESGGRGPAAWRSGIGLLGGRKCGGRLGTRGREGANAAGRQGRGPRGVDPLALGHSLASNHLQRTHPFRTLSPPASRLPPGYIKLELPVFHIGYFKNTVQILQCICKACSRVLLPDEERRVWLT